MMCGAMVSCSGKNNGSPVSEVENSADKQPVSAEVTENPYGTAVAADSGEACLAIADGTWWLQYWGKTDSPFAYEPGIAKIDGDGEYKVSVTADTKGFRFAATKNPDGKCTPTGLSFAAIIVKDGTALYPNMAIEITKVSVDGKDLPITAKNYTSSDDGVEMRANIFNSYIPTIPEDAHNADGSVYGKDDEYKAQIIDSAAFDDGWTTVEVTFNVTGTSK